MNYVILSTQNRNASAGLGPTHEPPTAAVSPSLQSNLLSLRPSSKTTPSLSFLTESYARQVQPGSGTTICLTRRGTVIPAVNSRWQLPRQWNRMRAWHRLRLVSRSHCSVAREHIDTGRDWSPIVNSPPHEPLSSTLLAGRVLRDDRQLSCHCSSSPAPTDASRSVEERRWFLLVLHFALLPVRKGRCWMTRDRSLVCAPDPRHTPPLPLVTPLGERGESSGMTASRDVNRRTASQFMHVYSCISYHQGRSTG